MTYRFVACFFVLNFLIGPPVKQHTDCCHSAICGGCQQGRPPKLAIGFFNFCAEGQQMPHGLVTTNL